MIRVGITGNIGSGKSTVCKIFETLGIPVYYADVEAKKVYTLFPKIKPEIIQLLGENAYTQNGEPNFEYIKSQVFDDVHKLQKLNHILHPLVFQAFDDWCKLQSQKITPPPYVVKEAAILFESGANRTVDKTILVSAPESLKILRASQRDGASEEETLTRLKNQYSEEKLKKLVDFVVINNGTEPLTPQVLALHRQLCEN